MARGVVPLSDAKVRGAKPKAKGYKLFDGGGLFLWVSTKGAKSWRMKYRNPMTGKDATLTFGLYPDISLSKARELREEVRRKIAEGIDPRFASSGTLSFEEAAKSWIAMQTHLSASHHNKQSRRIELYLLPTLAQKPIDAVTRKDISDIAVDLASRGKIETANRVISIASQILKYAVARGMIEHNVAADIDKATLLPKRDRKSFRTITDPEEIGHLLRAIDEYPGHHIVGQALKLLPLLAVRPGELRNMEWAEIDGALWHIPAGKMKSRKAHTVPLPSKSLEIIERMRAVTGEDRYVFRSVTHRNKPLSENTLNVALKRIGYGDMIVSHGFRAMFSTIAHERSGFPHEVIEAQLAHTVGNDVSRAYNRATYLDERRRLMEWWAAWLGKARKQYILR